MGIYERDWYRGKHPPGCTCVSCARAHEADCTCNECVLNRERVLSNSNFIVPQSVYAPQSLINTSTQKQARKPVVCFITSLIIFIILLMCLYVVLYFTGLLNI
jgi:hypothetical protein